MKKLFVLLLTLLLALGLTACTHEDKQKNACKITIGLVTDIGGVDDKSFNQNSWEGLLRYADEFDAKDCVQYLQSNSEADYIPNLTQFAEDGKDLIVAVGFSFEKALDEVAQKFPNSKFLFVDSVVQQPNVISAIFSAEEGSFLVGIAAGLKAKENGSNKVGFMGGIESDVIAGFQAGYEQGVRTINPDATIYVDYANSFVDDSMGQQLAQKQYGEGVTVIFQAAGAAGNGVIKEAKERGDVWAIGVDKDQYNDGMVDDGHSVILTSMLKRVESPTYNVAKDLHNGKFEGGKTLSFDLKIEGVGAEITEGRNLTPDTINIIKEYAAKIISGEIKVSAVPTIANGEHSK